MYNPFISVIIPVYNVEDYICDCLKSILIQDYTNLEIIIVNDCTQDNSIVIASDFIELLKMKFSFKLINHFKNCGLSAARNTGIDAAKGDYIFFLDSDDFLNKTTFSSFINTIITEGKSDIIIGSFIDKTVTVLKNCKTLSNNSEVLQSFLNDDWYEMACNKLISLKLLNDNNIRFLKGIYLEDTLFSYHLALHANSLSYNNEFTYNYRERPNSIRTLKNIKYLDDSFFVYERIIKDYNKDQFPQLFNKYVINKCYVLYKEIIKYNQTSSIYIPRLKLLLKTNSFLSINSLKSFLKRSFILMPFTISKLLYSLFRKIKDFSFV